MTSHHITIAKAAFTAGCLRPDVTQVTREEISNFYVLLDTVTSRCSRSNVQNCKKWLLDHVASSPGRCIALGKYLASYSKHLQSESKSPARDVSPGRKVLHLLYILNDLLHHTKYHQPNSTLQSNLIGGVHTQILELSTLAKIGNTKRVEHRLEELLGLWEQEHYFNKELSLGFKRSVSGHDQTLPTPIPAISATGQTRASRYVMPATHGDPMVPYCDLPAANLMPHITPNTSIPMRPDQIRALPLAAGPADESLVNAVKDFLKDVDHMDNPHQALEDDGIVPDMDELGQLSYRNEASEAVGDTYYGWSQHFCQKMKQRRKEDNNDNQSRPSRSSSRYQSASRSGSESHDRSRSPPKRKRYDRSRSASPPRDQRNQPNYPGSRSPVSQPVGFRSDRGPFHAQAPPSKLPLVSANMAFPPIPLGPNGLPMPLPAPPGYNSTWPPSLPPPPPSAAGYTNASFSPPSHLHLGSTGPSPFNQHSGRR